MAADQSRGTGKPKEKSDVIWISHRGYCKGGATENTAASFDAALGLGFTALETDLRMTRDGVIVLHHDDSLRATFGLDVKVSDLTWNDIQKLRTPDGEMMLSLDALYSRYAAYQWTFDMKPPSDVATLSALDAWAKAKGASAWLEAHIRFLVWSAATDREAKRIFPRIMRLARERECYRAGFFALVGLPLLGGIRQGMTYSVSPTFAGYELFSARILRAYHRRGARLLAYLPPSEDLAKKAYSLGFDEILTNGAKYF